MLSKYGVTEWTKQPQMVLKILDSQYNQQLKIQTITNNQTLAKTQSTPCQHIHCTPSSFLSLLFSP